MKLNKAILGLTLALLATTSGIAANAQTLPEPELYFYPAEGWNIRSQDVQNASAGTRSCNISTEFNNGFRLSFTGSAGQLDNLSLDFRQDVFQKGASYKATLSVPGTATIETNTTAQNGNLLTANLAGNTGFISALKSAGVLDIYLEQNQFRFYLTAFNAAVGKLEECTGAGMAPAVPAKDTPVIAENKPTPITPVQNEPVVLAKAEENPVEAVLEAARESVEREAERETDISLSPEEAMPEDLLRPAAEAAPPPFWDERPTIQEEPEGTIVASMDGEFPESIGGARFTELLAQQMNSASVQSAPQPVSNPVVAPVETMAEEPVQISAPIIVEPVKEIPPAPIEEISDVLSDKEIAAAEAALEKDASTALAKPREEISYMKVSSPEPQAKQSVGHMEVDVTDVYVTEAKSRAAFTATETETVANVNDTDNELIRDLIGKINSLEKDLVDLREENEELSTKPVAEMAPMHDDNISIASNNWDLERATMRFNEAERQIKRLGRELQKERARCTAEKEELEAMLFDPQLTAQQQIAKLADLEEQLSKAETELSLQRMRYEERIRLLEGQLGGN